VVPGAQHAFDVTIDRATVFERLAEQLTAFRRQGGGTIVDSTGIDQGRDLGLYEALSRSTGVHIVASTGMGPEELLGGYFLTPQTNPPTPWSAERFADLFAREVSEGMVVPRVERRAAAGLVATAADRAGMTPTEESLFRGAAQAALATGVAVSIRPGADALDDLDVVLAEGLPARRVVVGSLDRTDAVRAHAPLQVARRGAYVALDHAGRNDELHVDDEERAALVRELIAAGHVDRILLSSSAIGVAKGRPDDELPFTHVLSAFVPLLRSLGIGDADVRRILIDNPRELLCRA
jgi:phosphotriesterase-related protein